MKNNKNNELLQKELDQMKRNLNRDSGIHEAANNGFQSLNPNENLGQSVNNLNLNQDFSSAPNFNSKALSPKEAFGIALSRTLNSGAPVNNMGFYDEINWHLSQLGAISKSPLDIKQSILSLVKN